jgi:tetratricopeptide (TPR) repeat protein
VGLNIPYQTGRTTFVNGDLAADLLRRGRAQFPQDMRMHLYLGFTVYYILREYKEASEIFLAGSKLEGAPPFMAPLAARLLSTSGDAKEGLALAREMLATTTDETSRAEFEKRIRELEIEVQLQEVDAAVARFKEQYGAPPSSIDQLLTMGLYRGPLTDPSGGQIYLNKDGRAFSTSLERRYEVYE